MHPYQPYRPMNVDKRIFIAGSPTLSAWMREHGSYKPPRTDKRLIVLMWLVGINLAATLAVVCYLALH